MKKTLLFTALLIGTASFAQTSYTLDTYTSEYAPLNNPNVITEFGEDEEHWDDPEFEIPLGFNFAIGDQSYNTVLQMGSGATLGFFNFMTSTLNMFGFLDDFMDAGVLPGEAPSTISYKIEGNSGNRIAKVQYENAAFYEEINEMATATNRMTFQLWFYENGGVFEVHYGPSTISDPLLAFEGLLGPTVVVATNLDFNTFDFAGVISGNPANPVLSVILSDEDDDFEGLNSVPASGRVHRLIPSGVVGIVDAETPKYSVYPSPAQNHIWVKDAENSNAAYHITDITGKQIKAGNLSGNHPINVSDLNAGLYILSIDGMVNAVKFVKE